MPGKENKNKDARRNEEPEKHPQQTDRPPGGPNDEFEGYDEEKTGSPFQRDYDIDEDDSDKRSREFRDVDPGSTPAS